MKEEKRRIIISSVVIAFALLTLYVISVGSAFSGDVIQTTKCYDTDKTDQYPEGRNHYINGTVSGTDLFGKSFERTDSCLGNYLRESWCDKNGMRFEFRNIMRSELKLCTHGCSDGVCNK